MYNAQPPNLVDTRSRTNLGLQSSARGLLGVESGERVPNPTI